MARNVELLEKTMQHIKDHPEQHRQGQWITRCGTSGCFAGWAAIFSGIDQRRILLYPDKMPSLGAELLGLSLREANTLFWPSNTSAMLELMVKDLVNGDDLQQPYHYREMTQES